MRKILKTIYLLSLPLYNVVSKWWIRVAMMKVKCWEMFYLFAFQYWLSIGMRKSEWIWISSSSSSYCRFKFNNKSIWYRWLITRWMESFPCLICWVFRTQTQALVWRWILTRSDQAIVSARCETFASMINNWIIT